MTMTTNFSWEKLEQPVEGKLTTRRIFEDSPCNIFIAKDNHDDYYLIFQLHKTYKSLLKDVNISISSLKIDLTKQSDSSYLLMIKLIDSEDLSIFDYVLYAILNDLDFKQEEERIINNFLKKLKNWQKFMQSKKLGLMPDEKIRGLLAELYFMLKFIQQDKDKAELIIEAWYGPDRLQQDFIFNKAAIEIKSISNADKRAVTISSINQLESNIDNLYLSVFKVLKSNPQDNLEMWHLNSLVDEILSLLKPTEKTILISKLLEVGYMKDEKYDELTYQIQLINHYKVEENFPKLISKDIPDGIVNIKYDIDLNKIEKYKTELTLKQVL
jgi:hypothetical protein